MSLSYAEGAGSEATVSYSRAVSKIASTGAGVIAFIRFERVVYKPNCTPGMAIVL
ncbi:hypothetical protein GCM10009425_35670 [Pseudomonas asuensis]|uniref:Uncharacterized protein n=1 Tax=Pseudomonas asuensis TaxID=1825787 RepID=A0ABQ2GZH6_9PSED|nr:hypothetical protein GCM10009425_35670 [Pseudomonas asuensis]